LNCEVLWYFWTANEIIDKAICCTATRMRFQSIPSGKCSTKGSGSGHTIRVDRRKFWLLHRWFTKALPNAFKHICVNLSSPYWTACRCKHFQASSACKNCIRKCTGNDKESRPLL